MVEGVAIGETHQVDRAAVPAVTPRGAAAGDVLLAAERHAAVAAPSGADVDSGFVEKDQGRFSAAGGWGGKDRGEPGEAPGPPKREPVIRRELRPARCRRRR